MVGSLVSCLGVVMKTHWYTPLQWIPRSQTFFLTTYHDARPVLYLTWEAPSAAVMLVCLKEREPRPSSNTLKLKQNGHHQRKPSYIDSKFTDVHCVGDKSLFKHAPFHWLIYASPAGRLTSIGIPIIKKRRSHDRLFFDMGIPIPRKDGLYYKK